MRNVAVGVCVSVVGVAALTGCSLEASVNDRPTIPADALQKDLADSLTEAGETPQSVDCKDDLVGEVNSTARCEVAISDTNQFEVIVTTTGVEGSTVNYETAPALTTEQVESFLTNQIETNMGLAVSSVSCESGLEGDVGAVAFCDVVTPEAQPRFAAELTDVQGLLMTIDAVPVLTKSEVEASLAGELERQVGTRPESTTCTDDLIGKPGTTVDCTVTGGTDVAYFTLTVTGTDGLTVNYNFEPTS